MSFRFAYNFRCSEYILLNHTHMVTQFAATVVLPGLHTCFPRTRSHTRTRAHACTHALAPSLSSIFLQEMTLAGTHVRTIGARVIETNVFGVAASADMIVVTTGRGTKRVWVFDFASGDLIRSFGEKGEAKGQLLAPRGVRFTPDGGHIIIAEESEDNNRLSEFTLTGAFVRCVGVGTLNGPYDVDFAPNGDILVADSRNSRVCVFSPDGSTLLRAFGAEGDAAGQFKSPRGLAVHESQLYVIEQNNSRLQVFT